ncbi:MAG: PEP-CTERM sorting domain-containing protein [Planctomycetes bacterium]|nr:PEP-CTERM sorting domain-containing protein [Planctomycetota bacterium]
MKRFSRTVSVSDVLILAFAAVALFLVEPAHCETPGIALLLQQTPSQGGIVSPELGVHHYEPGSAITLIAVPKPGYQFVYWLGDVLDPTANKTTAYLEKPKIIIAVFRQVEDDQLVVGQNTTPSGGGGSGAFVSPGPTISAAGSRTGGGGGGDQPDNPMPPTERDDPFPPDDPPFPPDDPPFPPGNPTVPEPATGVLLTLGGLALLRKRRAE